MKKLILCIMLMLICIPVYAKEETFYYDDERVEEMWITKINSEETRSAHPYLLKRRSDNTYIYCLEPFIVMQNDAKYVLDNDYTKYGLTKETLDKINLIIYYGYGYDNHDTDKWYGVTQYLIWKEVDKTSDIYFTDEKNGERKDLYLDEINEINKLIENHNIEPNFINDYNISVNSDLVIDSNINLNDYEIVTDIEYQLNDNKLIFSDVEKGNYNVTLKKKNNRFTSDYLLYDSNNSQDVIIPGNSNIYDKEYSFNINVLEGKLTLEKLSSYNNSKLEGAVYGVYQDNNLIGKIVTNEDGLGDIDLPFGKYILKELEAPAGYKIDSNIYEVLINESNLDIKMTLTDDKEIIDVPNTGLESKKNYSIFFVITGIFGLIYGQKKCNLY